MAVCESKQQGVRTACSWVAARIRNESFSESTLSQRKTSWDCWEKRETWDERALLCGAVGARRLSCPFLWGWRSGGQSRGDALSTVRLTRCWMAQFDSNSLVQRAENVASTTPVSIVGKAKAEWGWMEMSSEVIYLCQRLITSSKGYQSNSCWLSIFWTASQLGVGFKSSFEHLDRS